jgi:hypothetical protein
MTEQTASSNKTKTVNGGPGRPGGKRWSPRTLGALLVLGLGAATVAGFYLFQEHEKVVAARKAAATFEDASAADHTLSQAFSKVVSCLTGVDAEAAKVTDFQKKLAQGLEGRYGTAGKLIKAQCTPAFRKTLDALDEKLAGAQKLGSTWSTLSDAARTFADEADRYADSLSAHSSVDQADHRMTSAAQAWSDSQGKDDAALRFESFLLCALPDPRARVDASSLFKWAAVNCTQNGVYAERLRSECLPKLDVRDEHPTDQEYESLESIRHTKVLNSSVSVTRYMLTACAERTRREWVATDAKPLTPAFSDVSAHRQAFTDAVTAIKPRPPQM